MKNEFIKTQIEKLGNELLIVENLIEDLGEMEELLEREAELKFALNEFLGELS
jgi:predicted ribosome quality control (RQC) complex YloA/Tae2 family protein